VSSHMYLSVKVRLKGDQTEDSIQEIAQELNCSFEHDQILDHEIVDVQTRTEASRIRNYIDLFSMDHMKLPG
jgi:adenylate cyclase class IV